MAETTDPQLNKAEWQAVAIALQDAAWGGQVAERRPGLLGRLYTALTGNAPRGPLADQRLEAIRGFVADVRRHHRATTAHAGALAAQGFNPRQINALALLAR